MALFGTKKKLTQQEVEELSKSLYVGRNPAVDRAYKTDPRTLIANNLMATGGDTSALRGGMTEGLARVASGLAGGYIGGRQRDQYGAVDQAASDVDIAARKPVVAGELGLDPATGLDPNVAALGDPNSALGQVAASLAPQQPVQPQQGAQPAPTLSPNFTQTGQDTVSPQQTEITPSPQLTPTQSGRPASTQPTATVAKPRVLAPGESASARAGGGFQSYQSPAWEPVEATMEQKHGLPAGTLKGLRMAERSNANQVSETGARSVYQFVPGTRGRFKRKYGVDAWAGPEQAAEAAALHIKESLARGRTMEQALRDYRGVDESADPGWYARARGGGTIPGGSTPSQPSPTSVPMAVPEMPDAPVAPTRPELPERVRSARLQVAYNLMNSGSGLNSSILASLIDPEYAAGMDETQKSKEAEYEAQTQLINNQFTSQLQNYNQEKYKHYSQPFEERTQAIGANINADAATVANDRAMEAERERSRLRIQEEEAEQKAKADNAVNRMPVGAQTEFRAKENMLNEISMILSAVDAAPEAFNLITGKLPDELQSRLQKDKPDAIKARALLQNMVSAIIHERSGAAVTAAEYPRLKEFLPRTDDDAAAVRIKLEGLRMFMAGQRQTLIRQYGEDNQYIQGILAASQHGGGTAPALAGLPAGVTVEEVK